MDEFDSKLCLFSDTDFLNEVVTNKFNNEFVAVKVIRNFNFNNIGEYDYFLVNLLHIKIDILDKAFDFLKIVNKKTIVLINHSQDKNEAQAYQKFISSIVKLNKNVGIILVPELLGDSVKYQESYLSHKLILQSLLGGRVVVDESKRIYTVSIEKLIETLVKQMLSFGINGRVLFVSGPDYSAKFFLKKFLKVSDENIVLKKTEDDKQQLLPDLKHLVNFPLKKYIHKSLDYMKDNKVIEPEVKILDPNKTVSKLALNIEKRNKIKGIIKLSILLILIIVALPLISIFLSIGLTYVGSKKLIQNPVQSKKIMSLAKDISQLTYKFNLGIKVYEETSIITNHFLTIADRVGELAVVGRELGLRIMGDKPYELNNFTSDISANLDRLYSDLSFIQSDIDNMNTFVGKELRTYLKANNLEVVDTKEKIYQFKKITSRLSDILGMNSPKKYLLLFQNNMELRPTGGFIGSYALLTFDKGMLSEMVVNDVYSADGQLKGHVDPPDPIRVYLGEGGWYLRDSNWDPDFSGSALKAKWFLDKEIDEKVDGVFAIDLFFIKNLLDVTGPINLTDFNTVVTSSNVYEVTQSHVEKDFFPGSIKKASFLTSLSKLVTEEVKNLDKAKYPALFKAILKSLEEKHIQIYFDDINAQNAINEMGYSGRVYFEKNCGERCYFDSLALIDANLGVNKSNYFVNRTLNLNINPEKDRINRSLLLTYNNVAGSLVGESGIYKNYARLLLPNDVFIKGVRVYNSQADYIDLNYDSTDNQNYKEIGFYFEVKPQTLTRIQIEWYSLSEKLSNGGEYKLYIRKQAGTDTDNIQVNLDSKELTLTGEATYSYNYLLVKDRIEKWFFKPK